MSDQSASRPGGSRADTLLAIPWTLYVSVIAVVALRIHTRLRPAADFGWDDIAITVAFLALSIQMGLLVALVKYGLGRHDYDISSENKKEAMRLLFIAQLLWMWAIAMCKSSITFTFLRIKQKGWRIFLYLSILLQLALAMAFNVTHFIRCQPVAAHWDSTILHAQCWDATSTQITVYIYTTSIIVTDFSFSFLPITFIRKLNRPMREKVVLCVLMGIGLIASSASSAKTVQIKNFGKTDDSLWVSVDIIILSFVEEQLGIIAASVPCLKSTVERTLNRVGLMSSFPRISSHTKTEYRDRRFRERVKMRTLSRTSQQYTKQESVGDSRSEENVLPLELAEMGKGTIVKTTEFRKKGEPEN